MGQQDWDIQPLLRGKQVPATKEPCRIQKQSTSTTPIYRWSFENASEAPKHIGGTGQEECHKIEQRANCGEGAALGAPTSLCADCREPELGTAGGQGPGSRKPLPKSRGEQRHRLPRAVQGPCLPEWPAPAPGTSPQELFYTFLQ